MRCASEIASCFSAIILNSNQAESETRLGDQQRGIFALRKPFFRRNTGCIPRKNGAEQGKKTRCLGTLPGFG